MSLDLIETSAAQSIDRHTDLTPEQVEDMISCLSDPQEIDEVLETRLRPEAITEHVRTTNRMETMEFLGILIGNKGGGIPDHRKERIVNYLDRKVQGKDPMRFLQLTEALRHFGVLPSEPIPSLDLGDENELTPDQREVVLKLVRGNTRKMQGEAREAICEIVLLEGKVITAVGIGAIVAWVMAVVSFAVGTDAGRIKEMQRQEALRFPNAAVVQPNEQEHVLPTDAKAANR